LETYQSTALNNKIRKSKLFRKTFASIVIGALAFTAVSYLASVPWLRSTVEQQEEKTGRVILDNTYQLALSIQQDVQEWRRYALETRRRELRHILDLTENSLQQLEAQLYQKNLPQEEVEKQLMEALRHLQFGPDDYIYLLDTQERILSHPLPQMHGQEIATIEESLGSLNIPQLIKKAQKRERAFIATTGHASTVGSSKKNWPITNTCRNVAGYWSPEFTLMMLKLRSDSTRQN